MSARDEQRAAADNAERATNPASEALTPFNWPTDSKGDPLAEVSIEASELIGLKEFSNITVGPARIRTLVSINEPNPFTEKQLANVASALNQLAETVEVGVVAEQRVIALNTIDPRKRHED